MMACSLGGVQKTVAPVVLGPVANGGGPTVIGVSVSGELVTHSRHSAHLGSHGRFFSKRTWGHRFSYCEAWTAVVCVMTMLTDNCVLGSVAVLTNCRSAVLIFLCPHCRVTLHPQS